MLRQVFWNLRTIMGRKAIQTLKDMHLGIVNRDAALVISQSLSPISKKPASDLRD